MLLDENCYSMILAFTKIQKCWATSCSHDFHNSFLLYFLHTYFFTCDNYTITFFFFLGQKKKSRQIVSAQYAFTFYTELTDSLSIVVSDVQVFRSRGSRARRYRRHAAAVQRRLCTPLHKHSQEEKIVQDISSSPCLFLVSRNSKSRKWKKSYEPMLRKYNL